MGIRVVNLHKSFGPTCVVDDVSFEVRTGELVALLGPSGGGKSTILRIIAGLETADHGEVWLGDRRVDATHPRDRQVGFVFQSYALFRHMSVRQNIAFGLDVQGVDRATQKKRVDELLELMGLHGLADRSPSQLSGGQRQRVALARALAPEPKLLLLDEPFGAVDAKVREELRRWLRRMHDEVHVTSIFVTHDQEEAFAVSDRVMIISKGKLEQEGAPIAILDRPESEFVARFVGECNVFDATVDGNEARVGALCAVVDGHRSGTAVRLVIRGSDLNLWRVPSGGKATVDRVLPLGDRVRVEATLDGGGPFFAQFPRRSRLLHDVVPGCRVEVEVTQARAFSAA
jgi:sulfate transport system ATP-binding protein